MDKNIKSVSYTHLGALPELHPANKATLVNKKRIRFNIILLLLMQSKDSEKHVSLYPFIFPVNDI